jgi:prepilin-type N-terminal cleavage/methylation domain-containing protein
MKVTNHTPRFGARRLPPRGFTLVEIALSIAIIGFALVAIIGVLPAGLNVQKENREETIVVHDANYLLDAIRSGARGLDDLTNYVESITNIVTIYQPDNVTVATGYPEVRAYTFTNTWINTSAGNPADVLTNGANIVGLLSTPGKQFFYPNAQTAIHQGFVSNYIIAYVRALSGPAVEKPPQKNASVLDLGFRYRLICELSPYSNWNTNWIDFNAVGLPPEEIIARSNNWRIARMQQANMHELRLLFRWPIKSTGQPGNQRQVFRTLVGGALTNQAGTPRWFMQPATYKTPL